jgi:two-component system LytT family sensor kinase
MGITLSESQYILVLLLVKVGVMASLATVLVRFETFKRILLGKKEPWHSKLAFPLIIGLMILLGVWVRLLVRYNAVDLSLEGSFLVGMLAGPLAGALTGLLVSIPAFHSGELLAIPMNIVAGLAAGGLRTLCPSKEALWDFSPFPLMNLMRFLRSGYRKRKLDWNILFLVALLSLDGGRLYLASRFPRLIFGLHPTNIIILACILYATALCLGIPVKIWNNTRIEIQLQEQNALLLQARFEALRSQINPHFLFNTLNSISSSIRTDPEKARVIIARLSRMFRTLLEQKEELVPLRDEMNFIDSYLTIQEIRYGEENFKVVRELDPATLDIRIPTMILQPVVENAIRHGISRKVGGGTLRIRTRLNGADAVVEIEDDGPGMSAEELQAAFTKGIGIQNIDERLRVIYGKGSLFRLESEAGKGTRATITVPVRENEK